MFENENEHMDTQLASENTLPLDLSSRSSESTSRTNSHESSATRSSENVLSENNLDKTDLTICTAHVKSIDTDEKLIPNEELPSCSQGIVSNNFGDQSPLKTSKDLGSDAQVQVAKKSLSKFSSSQIKQALATNIVTQRNQNLLSPLNPQVVAQMMANHTAIADIYKRHPPQTQEIFRPYISDASRTSPTSSSTEVNFRELGKDPKVDENKKLD